MHDGLIDAIRELQENPTGNSLYKLLREFHATTRGGWLWQEIIDAVETATGETVDTENKTPKKYTRHVRSPGAFFQGLAKGEIFTYSFSSLDYRSVEKEAARHGVTIEYMSPGTREYKLFGCCTCRRVK